MLLGGSLVAVRCGWTGGCCAGWICASATRSASVRSASRWRRPSCSISARAFGFSGSAPRVLRNGAALAATGLLQEGSRIIYRLMVAGEARQVEALRDELKPKLSYGEQLED